MANGGPYDTYHIVLTDPSGQEFEQTYRIDWAVPTDVADTYLEADLRQMCETLLWYVMQKRASAQDTA
jgi:hypothetical protein